ncbi:SH2 domain-containing protein 4A isoform X2 [Lepisosteus oculatus]|uniref:SH2 domain-containing protein 4A isoform X2 n=1 Tax=Lepisosteus oculatus TaxID=7918 RepID=UPI00073FC468|nr:PREDICTED: SH2 domain-containing protein 4A isoform X2 [Lepisosteus oculatus]
MLQQILADMYIEPELLAELNEEQKQILFFKMREEQVRRWKERETKLEKQELAQRKPKKASGKSISWLLGSDCDVWVWVMGEHPADKPYDQICDEIITERARQQAQKEGEEIRAKKEEELVKRFSNTYLMDTQMGIFDVWKKEAAEKEEQARRAAAEEKRRAEQELKRREAEERRRAEEDLRRLEEERTQQIYMDLKEVQQSVQKQDRDDPEWQETLQKSKAADERRRSIAKQARADYKRLSLKAVERGRVAAMSKAFAGEDPTSKPSPPPKPKERSTATNNNVLHRKLAVRRTLSTSNKDVIIKWFKEEQIPLRAGYDKDQDCIAPWFHGVITRQGAEELLSTEGPGHFLIRFLQLPGSGPVKACIPC